MKKKKYDLNEAMSEIHDEYGKGAIMSMEDKVSVDTPYISTTIPALDTAVGIGGVPCGRITEIYGKEQSGKTSVALKLVAEAQKQGMKVAYIDAEHELRIGWAEFLGVDTKKLLISQPDYGEQALGVVEKLVLSRGVGLIVVDSVDALVPKSVLEGDMGDHSVGVHARLMSRALRKIKGVLASSGTALVFINQVRMKIGQWGNPETTTGGYALKFYSAVRINLKKMATLKRSNKVVGTRIKATIKKNKVAVPFQEGIFDLIFDEGFVEIDKTKSSRG